MYNPHLAAAMQCGKDEKEGLRPLIELIAGLSDHGRTNGLLSLEDKIPALRDTEPLLALGLTLVVDGVDPSEVSAILEHAIASEAQKGIALARNLLILDGVLGIQSGINPRTLKVRLSAFIDAQTALRASYE
jgi:flagellar motor component MotA